jgi:hypothetical protein
MHIFKINTDFILFTQNTLYHILILKAQNIRSGPLRFLIVIFLCMLFVLKCQTTV